jgi:alpha-glucosidase
MLVEDPEPHAASLPAPRRRGAPDVLGCGRKANLLPVPDARRRLREPVELVRSDVRGIGILLVPAVLVGPAAVALGWGVAIAVASTVVWAAIFSATTYAVRRTVGRNAILVDERGLISVEYGRARRAHAWNEIASVAWHGGSVLPAWDPGGVIVTARDGKAPARVGSVVILRRRHREAVRLRVESALETLRSRFAPEEEETPDARAPALYTAVPPEPASETRTAPWWHGVLYHVYLRSFADSDGDGIGDLPGLISRLDHLAWLGVDGIWVSPVMPSPNDDFGYDVSDYCGVDPLYGSFDDVHTLVSEAGKRGMRILFDLVPNHSSDRHPWFVASRSSRSDPKREWYVWRDGKFDGSPPNNWIGNFFGPAWTKDERTGQYYLHSFLETQADLNWWNEAVREAFIDTLRFWFDRGIAGFRIDVVHKLVKDLDLRDNPPATASDSFIERAWGQREEFSANQPETHDVIREWRKIAESYRDPRVLLGETYVLDLERMASYYGNGDELNLAFNIPFLYSAFSPVAMRETIESTFAALPPDAFPVWNGGSHDISRFASRWCGGDERKIRVALMLLMTLRGTALLYYGDEIGMTDGPVTADNALDPLARRGPVASAGRDPARTPMQWSAGPGAGFTTSAIPWLPLGDHASRNVDDERADPRSVLNLCRELIALRRTTPDLASGDMAFVGAPAGVLAWRRGSRTLVALNMSDEAASLDGVVGTILMATAGSRDGEMVRGALRLAPWEGVVVYE